MAYLSMAHQMPDFTGKRIDEGRFELVRLLGAGGCGVVYLAVDHEDEAPASSDAAPVQCAIKIIRKLEGPGFDCQKREVALHHLVSDIPHVLPLYDAWEDEKYIYVVLEYCQSDLYRTIFDRGAYWGNDKLVRSVFLQILDAVHACHEKRVFHRDLKPENILCSADGSEVFIADFGLATTNQRSTTFGCGSAPYLSPESVGREFSYQAYSTRRADVWALGVILVNIVTGLCPWEKAVTEDPRFCEYLLDDSYLERTLPASRGVIQILKKLFRINPRSRPSLEQLRKSILAVDTFFPSRKDLVGRTLSVPGEPGAAPIWKRGAPGIEKVAEADEELTKTNGSGPSYVYDDDEACLYIDAIDSAVISDSGTSLADESGPATPNSLPDPLYGAKFVEDLKTALLPFAEENEPMKQAPLAELDVRECLDVLVLE